MKTAMTEVDEHLRTRLRVIIWKQWKVPGKRQWGLQKLGIGKDLARLTSYCGDRYQWVVTKTCVVRTGAGKRRVRKAAGRTEGKGANGDFRGLSEKPQKLYRSHRFPQRKGRYLRRKWPLRVKKMGSSHVHK